MRWQTGQGDDAKLWDECTRADTMANAQGQIRGLSAQGQFGELRMGKNILND